MKTALFVLLLLLPLATSSVYADDKAIERIRVYYGDVAAKAKACEADDDQGEFGELVMNTLTVNSRRHQWRAVGIYGQTYKFFYKGGDSEDHLYPDQLVFVKVERKESNRTYTEEYLYSGAGVLTFYSQKAENDDQLPVERRVYFSGAKAIRVVEDAKSRDRMTVKDAATTKAVTAASVKIKDLFLRSIKL